MYLKFMCRPSKMLQNGLCPLELSIIIEGKRKIIRFQKFIKASDFNASKQHVKRNPEVNEYMENEAKLSQYAEAVKEISDQM